MSDTVKTKVNAILTERWGKRWNPKSPPCSQAGLVAGCALPVNKKSRWYMRGASALKQVVTFYKSHPDEMKSFMADDDRGVVVISYPPQFEEHVRTHKPPVWEPPLS